MLNKYIFKNSLGTRLLASILLFSSFATVITTGIQLYIEYKKDIQITENIVHHTCKSHLNSMAENLWSVDLFKIEKTLRAIIQSPDIRYLEIKDKNNVLIKIGQPTSEDVFVQTFPLIFERKDQKEHIGFLRVITSYTRIRKGLVGQLFVIMSTQAIKTFLVSMFILVIFRYMVTRHLVNMAQYAKSLDLKKLDKSLTLNRSKKVKREPDELDSVVQAVNQMRLSLMNSFSELESKNNELQEMDRLKDQFLANTSHELRTPLNGIIGIVESMIEGATGPVSAKVSYNLTLVQSCSRRLFHLVDDILDFSKLKNRDIKLNLSVVDVASAVNAVLTLEQHLVKNKPLKLINSIPDNSEFVKADENRLLQILHNIIDNAIKFCDEGTIEVQTQRQDGFIAISVSDTGIGISENNLETIFESFEQVDGTLTRKYSGVGLGLNITKKLVELHGGKIQVESEFGVGTVVSFLIPLAESQPVEIASKPALFQRFNPIVSRFSIDDSTVEIPTNADKNFFKIMVVDDDLVVRQVLKNYLTMEKFNICLAKDGEEALKMIETEKPDIVLLDIMMPIMNGFDVCKEIRASYTRSEMPVIFLSARKELKDRLQGMNVAANDYLEKPIFKHELIARIQNQISIMMANRRLNSLLSLSARIGKYKDAQELVEFSFQIINNNIYSNGAILYQGDKIIQKSGDKRILTFLENLVPDKITPTQSILPQPIEGMYSGQLIYHDVKGFEEYRLCLLRKGINGEFEEADINFITNIISEIHLIRSNILKITYKHNRKEEIRDITRHLGQILFIEACKSNCKIILENPNESFETKITMQEIELYFGGYELVRVHRKHFVYLEKAQSLQRKKSKDYDLIIGDYSIPVGRTYLKKLREKHAYLFG